MKKDPFLQASIILKIEDWLEERCKPAGNAFGCLWMIFVFIAQTILQAALLALAVSILVEACRLINNVVDSIL